MKVPRIFFGDEPSERAGIGGGAMVGTGLFLAVVGLTLGNIASMSGDLGTALVCVAALAWATWVLSRWAAGDREHGPHDYMSATQLRLTAVVGISSFLVGIAAAAVAR